VCDEVGNLRTPFPQKADGSHFALTAVPFQGGSIGLSRRQPLRAKSNVSIHATLTEDGEGMTSVDDVMVFIIYR
jgi:hypothetical protein